MSAAPVTTDSAAILGEAWPDNATETASQQLTAVQQLGAAMDQQVQARTSAAGSMRVAAESSNFDVGHTARDSRISAYAAQAETANGVMTQAWWAILGHSRALEDTLTSIVYAYQPRLDAARVLASTDPAAGEAAYNEAMAEAVAEREAALAGAVGGIQGQLTILSSAASTPAAAPSGGSGGTTLGLFRGVANGAGSAAATAADVGAQTVLAELQSQSGEEASAAASPGTLSGFHAVADTSGTGGEMAAPAESAPSTLAGFHSEASSAASPALSAVDSPAGSPAGVAASAQSDLSTGASVASSSTGKASGAAADASASSASAALPDPAAPATGSGSAAGTDPSASGQAAITVAPATVTAQSAVAASSAPAPIAAAAAAAGASSAVGSAPIAAAPPPLSAGAGPAVMPTAVGAGVAAPAVAVPPTATGISQGAAPVIRAVPAMAFSPGAGATVAAAVATSGGSATVATSGVVASALGGTAANPANYAAPDKSVSGGLRYALAAVAALVHASREVVGIGWAVAGATSSDGRREFLFTSNMGGGYIPPGVFPYGDLIPAFASAPTAHDVHPTGDPAVALVDWQRTHNPDWQLTSIASSMPMGGVRGLVDPEVTQVRQLSLEDPVGLPMSELTEFTQHRLDVISPGSASQVTSVDPAKDFFQLAWTAHQSVGAGEGARSRSAVLDALAVARAPMPAVWDDLNTDYLSRAQHVVEWGPIGDDVQRYWSAFTDLMATEAILLGRGRLTPDRMADVIYAVKMSAGDRLDTTELPLTV